MRKRPSFAPTRAGQSRRWSGFSVALAVTVALTGLSWASVGPSLAQGPAAAVSGLHVSGNQILNSAGAPVRLRGVNETSSEYACIQGWGIFAHQAAGVSDAAAVQALQSWKINAVRLPLNEDCWLGINQGNLPAAYFGPSYRAAIADYVNRLTQAGIAVILDLHWAAPGLTQATYQIPMADRDHAPAFWTSLATTFKGNSAVIFDLFNEPYPDNNTDDSIDAWLCLRNGSPAAGPTSHCPGPYADDQGNPIPSNYAAAGMQELLNAVRATGATNLVIVGGIGYAGSLKQWLSYKPVDPLNPPNIAASTHIYPQGSWCPNVACWDTYLAPIAAVFPIVTGEIGQTGCAHDLLDGVITWLEGKGQSYLAWAWWTEPCASYGLIADYGSGAPTVGYGQDYRDRLAALAQNPTPTTVAPILTPTTSAVSTATATSTSRTPTPVATATPPTIGGRGLTVSSESGRVQLRWQSGSSQTAYFVARLAGGALSFPLSTLGPAATSFTDSAAPLGLDCYLLVVDSPGGQYFSDLLCAHVGFHSPTGSPQAFTLGLNQSSIATLTWNPPAGGGQDGYVLVPIGNAGQVLGGDATSISLPATGLTCYTLGALSGPNLLGYTDLVCGLPGFSNLGP